MSAEKVIEPQKEAIVRALPIFLGSRSEKTMSNITVLVHSDQAKTAEIKNDNHDTYESAKKGIIKNTPEKNAKNTPEKNAKVWVRLLINNKVVESLRRIIAKHGNAENAIVVPLLGHDDGKDKAFNYIPSAFAHILAKALGLMAIPLIQQLKRVGRTGATAIDRFAKLPEFQHIDEKENRIAGQVIILVDDHFTLGGAMAQATHFLHKAGAKVIAATALGSSWPPFNLYVTKQLYDKHFFEYGKFKKYVHQDFMRLYNNLMGLPPHTPVTREKICLTASEFNCIMSYPNSNAFAKDLNRAVELYHPNPQAIEHESKGDTSGTQSKINVEQRPVSSKITTTVSGGSNRQAVSTHLPHIGSRVLVASNGQPTPPQHASNSNWLAAVTKEKPQKGINQLQENRTPSPTPMVVEEIESSDQSDDKGGFQMVVGRKARRRGRG